MSKTGIGNIGNSPKMFIILTQTDFSLNRSVYLNVLNVPCIMIVIQQNCSFSSSSGIPSLSSDDSRSSTIFLTGQCNIDPIADWTVTDLTWPLLSRSATRTLAMSHLFLKVLVSFNRTISPSAKFLLYRVHLCLSCRSLQVLFISSVPKFISNMLYTPPASPAVNTFSLELSWRREYKLGFTGRKYIWCQWQWVLRSQ